LTEPGKAFLDRLNMLDLRVRRLFRFKGKQLEGQWDIYNSLNSNPVLFENQTFGAALHRPSSILQGRLMRFGVQARF
jgi:hypothetical protein